MQTAQVMAVIDPKLHSKNPFSRLGPGLSTESSLSKVQIPGPLPKTKPIQTSKRRRRQAVHVAD